MKKKTLAALALSATLAMGAIPAFAEEPANTEVKDVNALGEGNVTTTTVSVKTVVGQISAKIPINVTIAANMTGGAITAPTNSTDTGYRIENSSIFPIKVTAATAKAGEGWALSDKTIAQDVAPDGASTAIGDIYLTLTPGASSKPWVVTDANTAFATSDDWVVSAGTAAVPSKLGLQLAGATSSLRQAYENTPIKAVEITYTVGASPASTTEPDPAA